MKSFFFILLLTTISEISPNKMIIKPKFETKESLQEYNYLELTLGEYQKGILYSYCDTIELDDLINEIDNYLASSQMSDFLQSSIDKLNDALNYAKIIIAKEHCSQKELDKIKSNLNSAYNKLKISKGKTFEITITDNSIFDTERGFIHPGGLYTQEDFDRVKKKLSEEDEKIKEAYEK